MISTGAQLSELIANDWLIPLDMSLLPNFTTYASDSVKNPTYDPGTSSPSPGSPGSPASRTARRPRRPSAEPEQLHRPLGPSARRARRHDERQHRARQHRRCSSSGSSPPRPPPTTGTQAAAVLQQQKKRWPPARLLRPELHQPARERRHVGHARPGRATSSSRTSRAIPELEVHRAEGRASCSGTTTC